MSDEERALLAAANERVINELNEQVSDYKRRLDATNEKWRQLDDEAVAYSKCVRAIEEMSSSRQAMSNPNQRRVIDALAARFGVNMIDHARLTSMYENSYFGVSPSEREELEELRQMRKMMEMVTWPKKYE